MTIERESSGSTVALLAGGGIDSTVCMQQLHNQGLRVRAIHIDYGQPASEFEWRSVQATASRLSASADRIKIQAQFNFEAGEIPGRNAALIFVALMHLQSSEKLLCIGIHAGTPFFDCSESFYNVVSRLVAEQTDSRVRLIAPLLHLTKPEIFSLANASLIPLSSTYSCQRGVEFGCGTCHSCKDREALGC